MAHEAPAHRRAHHRGNEKVSQRARTREECAHASSVAHERCGYVAESSRDGEGGREGPMHLERVACEAVQGPFESHEEAHRVEGTRWVLPKVFTKSRIRKCSATRKLDERHVIVQRPPSAFGREHRDRQSRPPMGLYRRAHEVTVRVVFVKRVARRHDRQVTRLRAFVHGAKAYRGMARPGDASRRFERSPRCTRLESRLGGRA